MKGITKKQTALHFCKPRLQRKSAAYLASGEMRATLGEKNSHHFHSTPQNIMPSFGMIFCGIGFSRRSDISQALIEQMENNFLKVCKLLALNNHHLLGRDINNRNIIPINQLDDILFKLACLLGDELDKPLES